MLLALAWGFAEATVFFIVPDVLLSAIALRLGFKPAAKGALAAAIGAVFGGAVMFQWAAHDPQTVMRVLDFIPGISATMIATTSQEFASHGWPAMFAGAFAGVPYKLYAVAAGSSGASFLGLIALTIPARLPRFLLSCVAAAIAGRLMRGSPKLAFALFGAFWLIFYASYFAAHRG
jgi:membrane protein YqaA with SNARE-associated domain